MDIIEIFFLALIQGLTEFLPVSSSAHLILPSQLLGWSDQGLAYDVAVHIGSLLAVCLYFRAEIKDITKAWFATLTPSKEDDKALSNREHFNGRLAWWIVLASIPLGLFGFLGSDFIEAHLRSAMVIALSTIIFGLLLGFVDIKAKQNLPLEKLGLKGVLLIGLAQAIALIPGTSRSGITMTAGLWLGLSRDNSARISFLMSIPAICMAGGYLSIKLATGVHAVDWVSMAIGATISFVSAYACIHYFLILVNKLGMLPFVIYRLALGTVLAVFLM